MIQGCKLEYHLFINDMSDFFAKINNSLQMLGKSISFVLFTITDIAYSKFNLIY